MAIDTTIFAADIPAGTYTVGDVVPLVCVDGPANVRSGRGKAILKTILAAQFATNTPFWRIHVKNSDWIDDMESFAGPIINQYTVFDEESGAVQKGHDCALTPNSGWQVYAECVIGGTSTAANSLFALIDIDYPEVGGVTDPKKAVGFPTSVPYDKSLTTNAFGTLTAASWLSESIDYFKAGYKYVLDAVEMSSSGAGVVGFVAFSNAAGMGGLTRIIPVASYTSAIRHSIKYSSVLQKGPMEVRLKLFQATAATVSVQTVHDYVKQKA